MRSTRRFIRTITLAVSLCAAALLVGAGTASADIVWNGAHTAAAAPADIVWNGAHTAVAAPADIVWN